MGSRAFQFLEGANSLLWLSDNFSPPFALLSCVVALKPQITLEGFIESLFQKQGLKDPQLLRPVSKTLLIAPCFGVYILGTSASFVSNTITSPNTSRTRDVNLVILNTQNISSRSTALGSPSEFYIPQP